MTRETLEGLTRDELAALAVDQYALLRDVLAIIDGQFDDKETVQHRIALRAYVNSFYPQG